MISYSLKYIIFIWDISLSFLVLSNKDYTFWNKINLLPDTQSIWDKSPQISEKNLYSGKILDEMFCKCLLVPFDL